MVPGYLVLRHQLDASNAPRHAQLCPCMLLPADEAVDVAHRLYKLAMQRGFTRGRPAEQVTLPLCDTPLLHVWATQCVDTGSRTCLCLCLCLFLKTLSAAVFVTEA